MRLNIADIERNAKLQVRVRIDQEVVQDYCTAIKNGQPLPPVIVFAENGSERYLLADGWHRIDAAQMAGRDQIGAKIIEGTMHDALKYALQANANHGLRRTQADKRHAVEMALDDPEFDDWSLRDIADLCRVSHTFVSNIKQEQNEQAQEARKKVTTEPRKKIRPKPSAPDQAHVDRLDLRKALRILRSFPFRGCDVYQRIKIGEDDIREMRLVHEWLGEALEQDAENRAEAVSG